MERRYFAQVLKSAKVDIEREYERLYMIFNARDMDGYSWRDICERNFLKLPFKDTWLSLNDFDICNDFNFQMPPIDFDINYLVNYCEYIYNLSDHILDKDHFERSRYPHPLKHIDTLIEKIGYMRICDDFFYKFVPKSQPAIVVSEMLPEKLSYKVIEYNHHSMKGDLEHKRATLKLLADHLENKEDELQGLNKQFKSDIFYLFNNLNIRHNNIEKLEGVEENKLEEWYDYTYELTLQAFMMLENSNHKQAVCDIKKELGDV